MQWWCRSHHRNQQASLKLESSLWPRNAIALNCANIFVVVMLSGVLNGCVAVVLVAVTFNPERISANDNEQDPTAHLQASKRLRISARSRSAALNSSCILSKSTSRRAMKSFHLL